MDNADLPFPFKIIPSLPLLILIALCSSSIDALYLQSNRFAVQKAICHWFTSLNSLAPDISFTRTMVFSLTVVIKSLVIQPNKLRTVSRAASSSLYVVSMSPLHPALRIKKTFLSFAMCGHDKLLADFYFTEIPVQFPFV